TNQEGEALLREVMEKNTITIIINNFNYGRFLSAAIESVLNQTVAPLELIIVDDGSTDNSREILDRYKNRAHVILKDNGGQASCFNAGYQAASGDWIWFLDADDWLTEDAVANILPLTGNDVVKIHGPLLIANESGSLTGDLVPAQQLSNGDVTEEIIQQGDYVWPPTSGNIFSRKLLQQCMPIPEEEFRLSADFFLCSFAGVKGHIQSIFKPLGFYRVHSSNGFYGVEFDKTKLQRHGNILLRVVDHTERLVREQLHRTDFNFPYNRRFLESLMIAKRLGGLKLPQQLNNSITSLWLHSKEVSALSGKARITGLTYWAILCYGPVFLIKQVVKLGKKKASNNKPLN
ncbi:MAG: glycosyltransferase, partial [Chitinophagaceae bacterium]